MNSNTLAKKDYLFYQLFMSVFCFVWFIQEGFFKTLGIATFWESVSILGAIFICSFITDYTFSLGWSSGRNEGAIIANLIPFALYSLISRMRWRLDWRITSFVLMCWLVVVIYSIYLKKRKIKTLDDLKFIETWRYVYSLGKYILGVLALLFFVYVCFYSKFLKDGKFSAQKTEVDDASFEYEINAHLNDLAVLNEEEWSHSLLTDKLSGLQTVANIYSYKLDLETVPLVVACEIDNKEDDEMIMVGYYVDSLKCIYLNESLIISGTSREMVSALLHELFHVYEYSVVGIYDSLDENALGMNQYFWDTAAQYKYELANYNDGDGQDISLYKNQLVEVDANQFSEIETKSLFALLNE